MARKVNPIQLQKYLKRVDYPAHKGDLMARAKSHGAGSEVLQALEKLPGKEYSGPTGIPKEGGEAEIGTIRRVKLIPSFRALRPRSHTPRPPRKG